MYAGSQCKTQMETNQFIRYCHYSGTRRSQLSARDCHSLDYTDKTSQQRKSPTRFVPFVGRLTCSLLSWCMSVASLSVRPSIGWLTDCNLPSDPRLTASDSSFRPSVGLLADCN